MFLRLWAKGFERTEAVVLKATSSAGRMAVPLLNQAETSRAVWLNVRADTYLATLLAGENAILDLRAFGPERIRRLARLAGPHGVFLNELSSGELAAMSWLAEKMTQGEAARAIGGRILAMDFDALLADVELHLAAALAHFRIGVDDRMIAAAARSQMLSRYSKAPEQYAYSPSLRAEILSRARREHAGELKRGLDFLDRLGRRNTAIAAVL